MSHSEIITVEVEPCGTNSSFEDRYSETINNARRYYTSHVHTHTHTHHVLTRKQLVVNMYRMCLQCHSCIPGGPPNSSSE